MTRVFHENSDKNEAAKSAVVRDAPVSRQPHS